MNTRIDTVATRSRLHAMVSTSDSAHSTLRYRDNDLQHYEPTYRAAEPVVTSATLVTAGQNSPTEQAGEFIDLDTLPLQLESIQEVGVSAEAIGGESSQSADSEEVFLPVEARVEEQIQSEEGGHLELNPPRMRRIIFLATALPQGNPPFSKTQPNLGGVGLRYGLGRFTQISGDLGRLLLAMRDADEAAFNQNFGPDDDFPEADADELIAVATAMNPTSVGLARAPNMQSVSGKQLWDPEWIRKFKTASSHAPFQDAQFFVAAQTALVPMLDFARRLGVDSEKGMTLLTERAIQQGVANAQDFVIAAAGPISTEALKREALVYLAENPNNATLSAFQVTQGLTDTSGRLDAITHAALVGALRDRGNSPIPLPSQAMMFDQIAHAAADSPIPGLIATIRSNSNLSETPLAATDPVME